MARDNFLMARDSVGASMRRLLQSVLGFLGHTVVVPTWIIGDYVLLRGRRELGVRPDVCRCSLREAASPETLVAWVWAPVLLPNFGGPGPWTSKRLRF